MKRFILFSLLFLVSCQSEPTAPVTKPSLNVDPTTTGSLRGTVRFEGTLPSPTKIPVAGFPECANSRAEDTDVLVRDGFVQNAFVYIKSGLEDYAFPEESREVVLDQKGCLYEPRVIGLRVGQTVVVKNSDAMLHNVHAQPKRSRSFNLAMTKGAQDLRKSFSESEVMVGFRCDVHPWMRAYAGVLPHSAFAVTDANGQFEIKGIPPGTYTMAVWHERLGSMQQEVSLDPQEQKTISFVMPPQK